MRAWDNLMESPHFSPCLACCCCWKNLEEIRVLKGNPVFGEQICEIYGFSIFSPNLEHSHYPDMDKQVIPLGGKCFQIVSHPPHFLVSPIKMLISHPHIELTAICLLVWISWFPSLLRHAPWNKDDSDKGAKARVLAIRFLQGNTRWWGGCFWGSQSARRVGEHSGSREEQLVSELGFGRRLRKVAKIQPCTHYLEIQ